MTTLKRSVVLSRVLCLLSIHFLLACAAPSFKALKEYEQGNYCAFCRISSDAAEVDPRSRNNVGLCFERGLCDYTANQELAVMHYRTAARWDIDEAKQNLRRLGIEPPTPDLRIAQNQKNDEIVQNVAKVILLGLAVVATATAPPQPASVNTFAPTTSDHSGCCSYHAGIAVNYMNKQLCHPNGNLLCNDGAASPTCGCY